MAARPFIAALLAAGAAAEGPVLRKENLLYQPHQRHPYLLATSNRRTVGEASVTHVQLDIVIDASKSMESESDNQLAIRNQLEELIQNKVDTKVEEARQQVLNMARSKDVKLPDRPHVEISTEFKVTVGWSNSKYHQKEDEVGAISMEDVKYQGVGDWAQALELCRSDFEEVRLPPAGGDGPDRRRLTDDLPGLGGDDEETMAKAPIRICAIITDDRAMCDKDEDPEVPDECMKDPDSTDIPEDHNDDAKQCFEFEGDLGNIDKCSEMVKELHDEGIRVLILSKSSLYEMARMRNEKFRKFLIALGCNEDSFLEVDSANEYTDEHWEDWVFKKDGETCDHAYVYGPNYNEAVMAQLDGTVSSLVDLKIFDVGINDDYDADGDDDDDDRPDEDDESLPDDGGGFPGGLDDGDVPESDDDREHDENEGTDKGEGEDEDEKEGGGSGMIVLVLLLLIAAGAGIFAFVQFRGRSEADAARSDDQGAAVEMPSRGGSAQP